MAAKKYVLNPNTNREILVGGATYNKLLKEGVVFGKQSTKKKSEKKTTKKKSAKTAKKKRSPRNKEGKSYVYNPATKRDIEVGGATYKKLGAAAAMLKPRPAADV